jgi:Rieske Fe-S protein
MSEADDKYPPESGRRRFVKGVVGGSALAATGVTGAVGINSATTSPGAGGGSTQAMAIENTGGPAPRGMPQIPIEIAGNGDIRGVWPDVVEEEQGGRTVQIARTDDYKGTGVTYSQEWFQYCGVEAYQGLVPDFESDNLFKSGASPPYPWQSETYSEGDVLNVEDFSDYETWTNDIGDEALGKPATGIWRSEGAEDTIPVQVIRSPIVERLANGEGDVSDTMQAWLQASTDQGVIAWLNKCTHFCCVPGWKQSADVSKFGETSEVYCQCHQSVYDPFTIVQTLFVSRPRPE